MANCKICGRPVLAGNVFHSGCWETKAKEMAEVFCDEYCRWPRELKDEGSLQELHCGDCPLIRVLNLGL